MTKHKRAIREAHFPVLDWPHRPQSPRTARCEGRALLLCPGRSDVDLLSYRDGIIYLDAQVPHCAFDLGVAKK